MKISSLHLNLTLLPTAHFILMNQGKTSIPIFLFLSVLVSVTYFISGTLGLRLAVPPGYASAVFPASGIALAAVLLLGPRILPAILFGSAMMNLFASIQTAPLSFASFIVGVAIGLGATLQAAVGYFLINRFLPEFRSLNDERSILKFLFLVGPVSCISNATTSVSVLYFFGIVSQSNYLYNWAMWWIGDAIGAMVFTPLIISAFEPPIFKWNYRKSLTIIPSVCLFSCVVWFFFFSSHQLSEKIKIGLEQLVQTNARLIQSHIDRYQITLANTESLFSSSQIVTRDEFRRFVKRTLSTMSGIEAISWNPKVEYKDRRRFEESVNLSLLKDFHITELDPGGNLTRAGVRPTYFPVKYIEPLDDNIRALGFDTLSSKDRRVAIEKSILTGQPTITAKVRLVQEQTRAASVIMFYPAFKKDFVSLTTKEDKKKNNIGFVTGLFRIMDFITAALAESDLRNLNYLLYDVTDDNPNLLFKKIEPHDVEKYKNDDDLEKKRTNELYLSHIIEFGQRKWRFDLFPSSQYLAQKTELTAWSILVGGLFIVILLQSLLMVTTGRTNLVQTLVDQKTDQINHLLQDLKSEKIRFELAAKGASVGIWDRQDVNSEKAFWTEKFYTLLGYNNNEIASTDKSFSDMLHPEDKERTFAMMQSHFAGKTPFDIEFRLKTKQGVYRWFRGSGQAEYDEQRKARRMVGTIQDIHDRKMTEMKVLEQSEALKRTNEELEQFAYIASHDLQAPLRHISSYTQLLMKRVGPALDAESIVWANYIVGGVERMRKLISDILKFSRIGRGEVEIAIVDLNDIINEVKKDFADQIFKSQAVVIADTLPKIRGNRTLILQLFENLVGNAIKYRDPARAPRIEIRNKQLAGFWEFSVSDNGIGFEEEFAERIFGVFQRLHKQNEFEGTGIGLSICRKIVEFHGGSIRATSVLSKGSTFVFTFPIKEMT